VSDIYGAAPECVMNRCLYSQARTMLDQVRTINAQLLQRNDRSHMSQALWCDSGGHAFSERDPGRQRISVNSLDEDTGEETSETRDFCGDCAEKAGLLAKRRTRPAIQPVAVTNDRL
jgi:hypothetical protein